MKNIFIKSSGLLALAVFAFVQPGCKNENTPVYQVQLASSATLGDYLVDRDGRTLYYFSNDATGRTTCFGGCAALWPYFSVAGLTQADLGPGLALSDFDTIMVNGVSQLRYKTWPLYYYAPLINNVNVKEPSGTTLGEGYGNIWFVAKPDYSVMLANNQLVGLNGVNYTGNYTPGTGLTLHFTDAKGISLYVFKRDSLNKNDFTKSDLSNNSFWPIYDNPDIVVPSILDKSLFGHIDVYGYKQMTYNGWPLYYYGQDNNVRGNTKGVSVPTPGIWMVAVKELLKPPSR